MEQTTTINESSGAGRFLVFMIWALLAVMVMLHFTENSTAVISKTETTTMQWAADSTWNKGWK